MKRISLADVIDEGVSHNPEIKKRVLLKKGDVPHLTNFSRSLLLPGQVAQSHLHPDMFELFFVESGTGIIRIDDVEQQIEEGVLIVVEPGETHEILNNGSSELILYYFGVEL